MKVPKRLSKEAGKLAGKARELSDFGQLVWSKWRHPPATVGDAVKILGRSRILGLKIKKRILRAKIPYTVKTLKAVAELKKSGGHDFYLLFLSGKSVGELIRDNPKAFTPGTQRFISQTASWVVAKNDFRKERIQGVRCRLIDAMPAHLGTAQAFEQTPEKSELSVARMSTALELFIALKKRRRAPEHWSHVDIQCYYPRDRLPPEAVIVGVCDGELLIWIIDLSLGLRAGVDRVGVINCYKPDAVT